MSVCRAAFALTAAVLAAAGACGRGPNPGRATLSFEGEVAAGSAFERPFGPGLLFRLEPGPCGWKIEVRGPDSPDDLARLTPPFHFVPNPRDIEGWHFRNADNSGPNEAGEKNVNAPGAVREFVFSPEAGKTAAGPGPVTEEDVTRAGAYGRGTLVILDYRLAGLEPGMTARFEWMRFRVELSWPAVTSSRPG